MTECTKCEKTIHEPGYFEVDDYDGPLCRGCYKSTLDQPKVKRTSKREVAKNREYYDHRGQKNRKRIMENWGNRYD